MQVALILKREVVDDVALRKQVIESVKRSLGILNVDLEMAENGLLLAEYSTAEHAARAAELPGIESVESLGVKSAI